MFRLRFLPADSIALMKQHAMAVFHCPPVRLNCAQAVLDAFQTVTGRHVAAITDFKSFGGGRAPGGECGALYAACQAAPESARAIRTEFTRRAGANRCRDLTSFHCQDCVALAAELLQQYLAILPASSAQSPPQTEHPK